MLAPAAFPSLGHRPVRLAHRTSFAGKSPSTTSRRTALRERAHDILSVYVSTSRLSGQSAQWFDRAVQPASLVTLIRWPDHGLLDAGWAEGVPVFHMHCKPGSVSRNCHRDVIWAPYKRLASNVPRVGESGGVRAVSDGPGFRRSSALEHLFRRAPLSA